MGLPIQLLNALSTVKGFDSKAFEAVHASGEQVTSIRLNPFKNTQPFANLMQEPIPWCKQGHYLSARPSFTLDPVFHAGGYYVQEASSMFLWHALEQLIGKETEGKKVLDLCAAPGGKSTLLASYFADGLVVANEVIKSRSAVLVENITKWGQPNVIVTNNDPDHFKPLESFFDVILTDAPCSGSGLFRKDPAAIDEWSQENVLHCSQRQEKILAAILPSLKEEGILLYATCSYSVEEDEKIAEWLVAEMGLQPLDLAISDQWNIVRTASANSGAPCFRFYPNLIKGEGFFIAAFKKTAPDHFVKWKEVTLPKPAKNELELMNTFFQLPDGFCAFKQNDAIRIIPTIWMNTLQQLAKVLYIKKAGIEIGSPKGKDLIPAHELAVSTLHLNSLPCITVNKDQALQYLRRNELQLEARQGWYLLKFDHVYLGWVKVLANRVNNYYPAEWRILKG